jgi:lipid-A-disaccharide synthase
LFCHSEAAIITSGTATLEAALFRVPQVVCYKANPVSYAIAKQFVKVKYISLVNLNMDKEVVKELIQDEMNQETLKNELNKIIYDKQYRGQMLENYQQLRNLLGNKGASVRVARAMKSYLTDH